MATSPRAAAAGAVRDAVPFVTITVLWSVIMLVFYAGFLLTRPPGIDYQPWVFASVFVVPGIGFVGHVLKQAIHG